MRQALEQLAQRLNQYRGSRIGEQNTKAALVEPMLRALGWDTEDVEEVHREYRRRPSDKPVDYALMLGREPRLFVEAKGLDENLNDHKWAIQIISYATVAGVEWVVLTNGDEYRIFNAHAPVPVEEKLFKKVSLSDDGAESADALRLLAKDQIQRDSLAALWRAHSIDRRVQQAVEALFEPDPNPWLVGRLSRSLDGLTAGDVRAALQRARIRLDFPSPTELTPETAVQAREEVPASPRKRAKRSPASYGVSLTDLIRGGFVTVPFVLTSTYFGQTLSARIEPDGTVTFEGKVYPSLSTAAGMARASVRGAPPGRDYPQTNGWTFWKFVDESGVKREIDVLRRRFLRGRESN
jgi:Restriction Enzyme Adenine Methylase Associated